MTNMLIHPTLTREQLQSAFNDPKEEDLYTLFPDYPVRGLSKEEGQRIWESSIKTALIELWHVWDTTIPVDPAKRQKALSLEVFDTLMWFEVYGQKFLETDHAIEAKEAVDDLTTQIITSMTDYILQTLSSTSSRALNDYESNVVAQWSYFNGVIEWPENIHDIQEITEEAIFPSLLDGWYLGATIITYFSLRLMHDYEQTFGVPMSRQDFAEIEESLLALLLKMAIKSRDFANKQMGHFVTTDGAITFSRDENGKLAFVFNPPEDFETLKQTILSSFNENASPEFLESFLKNDFTPAARSRMGCPFLHAKQANTSGPKNPPLMYAYLRKFLNVFAEHAFSTEAVLGHDASPPSEPNPA